MKKYLTCTVTCLIITAVCAYGNLGKSCDSSDSPAVLAKNRHRHIIGVTSGTQDRPMITTLEEQSVNESCVRLLRCDLSGRIRNASQFVIRHVLFIRTTNDPNFPVVWLSMTDYASPTELWMAEHSGEKLQPKLLLRRGGEDKLSLQKCWLFQVGGKKKVFVQKRESKVTRPKGELKLAKTYWLYCYALEGGTLKLEGKAPIGEGQTASDELSVECALVDGKVYVWVCEHLGKWRKNSVLRVAQWHNKRELNWTKCYKGGHVGSLLAIDPLRGSAATIFERKGKRPHSSAVVCQLPGYMPRCTNLGYGFGGKPQLLHVQNGRVKWLLLNYEAWNMRILALDDKLEQVRQVEKNYPNSADLHLVRGNDESCYVVISMQDHIRIEKLQGLPTAESVPREDSEELSQEMIAAAYKEYTEGEGKNLLKATYDQLAKDIVTGDEAFLLISYYRLLSHDHKRAEGCLAERITSIVKEGAGKEHWITDMQLTCYGQTAVKPLLRIAATGAPEERQIAIEALYLVPDLVVVNQLIQLLDEPDVRKNAATFLMICDMGVRAGKPQAMDFLIKAATGKFREKGDFDTERLLDESREMLLEITREYENTPQGWSEEAWSQWWTKHREIMRLEKEPPAEVLQRRKELSRGHLLFQKLAKMLEQNR